MSRASQAAKRPASIPQARDTNHAKGYRLSQRLRKRCENIFGWMKTTGARRKSRGRGVVRTHPAGAGTNLVTATCNLARMARLMEESRPRYKTAVV